MRQHVGAREQLAQVDRNRRAQQRGTNQRDSQGARIGRSPKGSAEQQKDAGKIDDTEDLPEGVGETKARACHPPKPDRTDCREADQRGPTQWRGWRDVAAQVHLRPKHPPDCPNPSQQHQCEIQAREEQRVGGDRHLEVNEQKSPEGRQRRFPLQVGEHLTRVFHCHAEEGKDQKRMAQRNLARRQDHQCERERRQRDGQVAIAQ